MNKQPRYSHLEEKISMEEDLALIEKEFDRFDKEEMRSYQRDSDIHKLHRLIILLSVLIPCVFAAVIAFFYLDVRKRLTQMDGMGSENLDPLSNVVMERVTSLSEKFEALEESFEKKLSVLKEDSSVLQEKLQNQPKTNSSANTKMIKADLEAKLARQQTAIEKLSKRLEKLNREANAVTPFPSDLQEQGERFIKASTIIESLQKKVLKLERDMKLLSKEIVTKEALEKTEKKTADLERKANVLVEELLRLENKLKPR